MRKVDTLILGAGISGLTYASHCKNEYLIVEKDKTPGGMCRTFYQDDFVWDYAGHFFHFKTDEMRSYFENRIPQNQMVTCRKNTKIYYKGEYIDYPFQMNIHELPKDEFIECLYDLHFREQKNTYVSFEEMLYGKFGKGITEKFLKPYNEKLYACNLNMLDVDAMGRFFPYASETEIIRNMKCNNQQSYNDTFDYPKKGAQQFVDVLLSDIKKDSLLLEVSVKNVDMKAHIAYLSNGDSVLYKHLINTIPLNEFLNTILQKEQVDNALSANKVLVFNLGFDKNSMLNDVHWIYYPEKEYCFYRVGFYNNILGTNRMSLYVEIGYETCENVNVEKALENVLSDLKKCGVILDHKLVAWNYVEMNPAYVHVTKSANEYLTKIFDKLKADDIYSIGRYGGWKYCSIEDCMLDAISLANII